MFFKKNNTQKKKKQQEKTNKQKQKNKKKNRWINGVIVKLLVQYKTLNEDATFLWCQNAK